MSERNIYSYMKSIKKGNRDRSIENCMRELHSLLRKKEERNLIRKILLEKQRKNFMQERNSFLKHFI